MHVQFNMLHTHYIYIIYIYIYPQHVYIIYTYIAKGQIPGNIWSPHTTAHLVSGICTAHKLYRACMHARFNMTFTTAPQKAGRANSAKQAGSLTKSYPASDVDTSLTGFFIGVSSIYYILCSSRCFREFVFQPEVASAGRDQV